MNKFAIALISTLALTCTAPSLYAYHYYHDDDGYRHHHRHHHDYDRYYYYYGDRGSVYSYGSGINQTWCENNPRSCAKYCAKHSGKCRYHKGVYFIIRP